MVGYVHLQCQHWGCRHKERGMLVGQFNLPYLGNSRLVRCAVSKTKRWTMHTHTHACMHVHTHMRACTCVAMHLYTYFHMCMNTLNTHKINVSLSYYFFSGASEQHITLCLWRDNFILFLCFLLHSFFFVYTLMHIYLHLVYSLFQGIYVSMQ